MGPGVTLGINRGDFVGSLHFFGVHRTIHEVRRYYRRTLGEATTFALIDEIRPVDTIPGFGICGKLQRAPHRTKRVTIAAHDSSIREL